jgi:TolB-like protein/AraC-like DNA-binding protein
MDEPLSLGQAFIKKLADIILANLRNEKLGVEELSRLMGMSHSTIHRKLRSYTQKSLSQFIREVRLQKAHEMLRQNLGTVAEISYRVGFGSPTYFNKCFHEYYGYPPGDVKKTETGIIGAMTDKPDLLHLSETQYPSRHRKVSVRLPEKYKISLIIPLSILSGLLLIWFIYSTFLKNTDADGRASLIDKSIAVLPFENLSGDPENQYFADGVMEDILNQLFRESKLRVISGTTAERFRESNLTVPEISKKLRVNYILEGSVQKCGSRTRVLVQLIDARHDQHLWSEKYDRELNDLFLIQTEIAKQVVDELKKVLSAEEIEHTENEPKKSSEAYNNYLRRR